MEVNPFHYSIGTRVRIEPIVKMLEPKPGENIIDVGSGLGYFTDLLAKSGAKCTGVDLDKLCISYCQKEMRGEYDISDVHCLPFPDNHFDKALCTEVLEHVNLNGKILEEIRRVVKKGGTLVVSVPCSEGIFGSFFKRIGHDSVDGNSREYHWHKGYTLESINQLLEQYNFKSIDHYYTLVAATEAFMGISKIVIRILRAKKIDSQANALEVNKTLLWKIYCRLFPLVLAGAWVERPLGKYIKGHMVVVKGFCEK